MKRITSCLLILFSGVVMAPGTSAAQSSSTVATTAPVLLGAEFQPGETARYTFSLKMNLTSRVNPSIPSDRVRSFTPRMYQVEGEVVATFAPVQPGEPLRGRVGFQGLTVKNWVSSAKVAGLEARLRQLEATPTTLTAAADGTLKLAEMAASPINDLYVLDVEDLFSIAQAVFISRISSQPLALGQQRASAEFPIPGMVKPGIKMTVLTEYITDIPIARHRSPEVRLSMNVPAQFQTVPSPSNAAKMFEQWQGAGVWTYLLDLDAHQISLLHKTIRSETSYSTESADSNTPVRIPANLFTVNMEFEVTARRVAASASPEREADLAAFEKSLAAPPRAAAEGSGATTTQNPGGGVSLGDIARRLRAERAAQGPPQAETAEPKVTPVAANTVAPDNVPAGFRREAYPSGAVTVHIPDRAEELNRRGNVVTFRLHLGTPTPLVIIVLMEMNLDPGETAAHAMEGIVPGLEASGAIKVLHTETKTIHGMPGIVIDALQPGEMTTRVVESLVISRGEAFITSCGTLPNDFAKVQSLCQQVIESPRAQ